MTGRPRNSVGSKCALSLALLACAGCGRIDYSGDYTQVLIVDITEDRLAGPDDARSVRDLNPGTVGLSLREAMVIANHSPGPDLIVFDDEVFHPERPGVITPTSDLPPLTDDGTEIYSDASAVVLEGGTLTGAVLVVDCNYCEVDGLTIRDAPGDAVEVRGVIGGAIYHLTILDPGGRGIYVHDSEGLYVKHHLIERAGSDLVQVVDSTGIYVGYSVMNIGDKGALRGVRFERVTDSFVYENLIDPGPARLVDLFDSSRNSIHDNVLDRGHAGVVLEGASHENVVLRNVVVESAHDGIYVYAEATGNTVVHNTMLLCAAALVDGASDTVIGNNLVSEDPAEFLDAAQYDFTLVADHPAIDAGEALGYDLVSDDPDALQFLGAAPDLGAIETR